MTTHLALLRGINVGGKNTLPMKSLTKVLEQNGFDNVITYLQTGNVIFNSASNALGEDISRLIEQEFGFQAQVLVLDKPAFKEAVIANPFKPENGKDAHIYFCKSKPKADITKIKSIKVDSEEYAILGNVFYLLAPNGIGRSKLVSNLESHLGVPATGRNLNTINKVLNLMS